MTTTTTATTRRPAWLTLTAAELRLLLRNRIALVVATVSPLALGGFFLLTSGEGGNLDSTGDLAAMQLVMLLGFAVYVTPTMTLAARREQLYLKRLRSSPASAAGIVTGLMAPLMLLAVVQAVLLFTATGAVWEQAPGRPAVLVLALLVGCASCVGLAFLTAAFTRTSEAAQLTTLPGFFALVGGLVWVVATPPERVDVWQLAVPGAAVAQLARYGWDTPLPAGTGVVEGWRRRCSPRSRSPPWPATWAAGCSAGNPAASPKAG
jgi:ABC-2 type transport system permease protein